LHYTHLAKGDPVDVANIWMMLRYYEASTAHEYESSAMAAACASRDEVIARLVEAVGETLDAIDGYNRTLPDEDGLYWDRSDLITQEIMSARAALAAAKAVRK